MSAVAATGVVRTFGAVTAVANVSVTVRPGEVVGLVGANGAGKTTLLRLLLGLLAPDAGRVELAGGPPTRARRRHVGYVPQSMGLWADLSLREHLALVSDVYGTRLAPIHDEALARTATRPVGTLPLGLRRRAAFVVALAHDPSVLLLDEPTSGVDPLARSRLWDTIRTAASSDAGVLVSTHYLDEAARCDRVVLLADGRVVADGPVGALTRGRRTVLVASDRWEQAWRRLEDAGLAVLPAGRDLRVVGTDADPVEAALAGLRSRIDLVPTTLDEVFLTATGH